MSVNQGFPTIRKVLKNGNLGKDYEGDRSTADMIKFIKDNFVKTPMKGGETSMKGGGKHKTHMKRGGKRKTKKTTRRKKRRNTRKGRK